MIPHWINDASYEQFCKSVLPNESPKEAYKLKGNDAISRGDRL